MDAMELIRKIAEAIPSVDKSNVLRELADHSSKEKIFAKPFVWTSALQKTPTSWWNGIYISSQLSKVAANIFRLPPTGAAVACYFSRHSWIHFVKQNRLMTKRASKLVFIAHNLVLDKHEPQCDSRSQDEQPDQLLCSWSPRLLSKHEQESSQS
jgi:predicted DNA-binding protein (MmcQ/YjbR family)